MKQQIKFQNYSSDFMKDKKPTPKQVKTDSNIPVKPAYDSKVKPRSKNEQPGKFPYTRAIQKGKYRDRL